MAKQDSGEVKELFPIRKYVLGKIWISSGFFQSLFEKSQFNPSGLIRLFSNGLIHLANPDVRPKRTTLFAKSGLDD